MHLPKMQIDNVSCVPSAYVEQYIGAWAIDECWATQFVDLYDRIDLAVHSSQLAPVSEAYEVRDGVAIVEMRGMMTKRGSSLSNSEGTIATRRKIRAAAADPSVDAIMLVIESPGGTVSGTMELANDVKAATTTKHVTAFIEDIGASAAYYVASQATDIYANQPAMVGSIGTFMVLADMSEAAEQAGVKVHVIRAGDFKGVGEPGTEITAEQLAYFQELIDASNKDFTAAVQAGRGFSDAEIAALATGKVYTASMAEKVGLIDGVRTYDDTFSTLQEAISMSHEQAPATLAQLKDTLVGADAEFLVSQLDANATLQQASEAWMLEQQIRLEAAAEKAAEAELKAQAAMTQSGVDPVGEDPASPSSHASALQEWNATVDRFVNSGKSRQQAVLAANRANPELRDQAVAEYNQLHRS